MCKCQKREANFFCKDDKVWLCNMCVTGHFFHHNHIKYETNKEINAILNETYKVLSKTKKTIVELMEKIEII